jgi:hypothetical protein
MKYHPPHFILLVLIPLLFLTACAPAAPAGPSDECGMIEPTQREINKILSFGGNAFPPEQWSRTWTVEPYKMSLFRQNETQQAIAYIEYLIYTCGYGQAELDEYFGNEGLDIVFDAYESHSMVNFCEEEKLALFQFDLMDQGAKFSSNYWVEQTDDNHVLAVLLVFPESGAAQLDEYSKKLFPELNSCQ